MCEPVGLPPAVQQAVDRPAGLALAQLRRRTTAEPLARTGVGRPGYRTSERKRRGRDEGRADSQDPVWDSERHLTSGLGATLRVAKAGGTPRAEDSDIRPETGPRWDLGLRP